MPIRLQQPGSDMFASGAGVLVNTVNTVGVMGAGVALQFKKRWPEMFEEYRRRCGAGLVRTGEMDVHVVDDPSGSGLGIAVANFPTKQHWRDPSRLEWVEQGLVRLPDVVRDRRAAAIAIPPLGCGLGGLDWRVVSQLIVAAMAGVADEGVDVLLYQPAR